MADYLLDTNHASTLVTLHHDLRRKVLDAWSAGHTFAICAPVLCETLYGISTLPRAVQNRREWAALRQRLTCYDLEETDAECAADLQVSMRLSGNHLQTVDALIAAVALRYGLILLTSDKDFHAIPNLRYENWR